MLLRRRVLIRTLGRMALERTIRRNKILSVFVAPPHESCTMRSNCSPWPRDTTTLIDCTLFANVKFIMKPSYRVLQRVSQQKSDLLCLVTTRRRVDGIHHKIITLLQRSIGYVRVLHTFQCDRPPALRQTLVVSFRESVMTGRNFVIAVLVWNVRALKCVTSTKTCVANKGIQPLSHFIQYVGQLHNSVEIQKMSDWLALPSNHDVR